MRLIRSFGRIALLSLAFISGLFGTVVTASGSTFTLQTNKTGSTGTGTIKSVPSGIDCGITCSFDFDEDSLVTLKAVPGNGSYFNGWSGDCSSQALTCTLTIEAAKTVTANFTTTPPAITPWVKTVSSTLYDGGSSAIQTSDGGYIIAGKINNQYAAVKLSANGSTIQWQKIYAASAGNASAVAQTADGGYILGGSMWVGIPGVLSTVPLITKVDADGQIIWQKYVYEYYGTISSIQQVSDGGFVVSGPCVPTSSWTSYFWIAKIEEFTPSGGGVDAQLTWGKTFGTGGSSNAFFQTPDGGFIASGSNSSGPFVVKLDSVMSITWQNNYTETHFAGVGPISPTSDGGYVMTISLTNGAGVMKLNPDGSIAWQKTYTTSGYDHLNSVRETYDGNFVVAGGREMSSATSWSWDIWVLKLNPAGEVVWQKTYSKSTTEEATFITQASDGTYMVTAGPTNTNPQSTDAMWLMKLDQNGNVLGCTDSYATALTATVSDYNAIQVAGTAVQTEGPVGITSPISPASGDAGGTLANFCSGTGPMLSVSPGSPFDFGTILLATAGSQAFVLSNLGNADLTLQDIWIASIDSNNKTSGFSYDVTGGGTQCGSTTASIAAGDSCTVLASFDPSYLGSQSNDLYIYSNNPGPAVYRTLNGTGALDVTVSLSGTQSGSVSGNGINCTWDGSSMSGQCTLTDITAGFDLTASPGSCNFVAWSTACSGTDTTCTITTNGTAGATFAPYPLAWSGSPQNGGSTITAAYTGSGVIYVQNHPFYEDLVFANSFDVSFDTGWNCDFTLRTGNTTVKSLTVSRGSVTLANGALVIGGVFD